MKILVIGCGSIGRRHARNARALGADVALCDINELRMREFGEEIGASAYFTDFNAAASLSAADAAVIATPSNFHIAPAHAVLRAGLDVLIEKPLCTSVDEAISLRSVVRETGRICMMAHTYRFRSEWVAVKRFHDDAPLGRAYSAEFLGGWYLPDWHVREDYRREYAAQKKLGGGVLLTSLSHFFDVVNWFFGDIERITGALMRVGTLGVDVDDTAVCAIRTASKVAVTISEDFLSRCPRRLLRINYEHGYVEADFNRKTLSVWDDRKKRYHPDDPAATSLAGPRFRILEDGVAYDLDPDVSPIVYSGNDAYRSELEYFIDHVASRTAETDLDIDAGISVLKSMSHAGIVDWTSEKAGD